MGWSYRKRLRFGPLRVNVSRSGIGTSWGVPGFRVTHSSAGRRYITLSLPGTGLSWRKTLSRPQRSSQHQSNPAVPPPRPIRTSLSPLAYLYAQSVRSRSQTQTGTSGPLVNGLPWWQQKGMKKGPESGP